MSVSHDSWKGAEMGARPAPVRECADMFNRVLVATDLTATTRASLRAAFEAVRRDDGEVLLVHVVRRIPAVSDREMRAFYEKLRLTRSFAFTNSPPGS